MTCRFLRPAVRYGGLAFACLVACTLPTLREARAQESSPAAPGGDAAPELHLYYADTSDGVTEIRAALREAAQAQSLPYAEHDMADQAEFQELLRIEEARGIIRYGDLELFAGDRYFAGRDEVLDFLKGLIEGDERLLPGPRAPGGTLPPQGGMSDTGTPTATAYRTQVTHNLIIEDVLGPWNSPQRWWNRTWARHPGILSFVAGLAAGAAAVTALGALRRRRRTTPAGS